MLVASRESLTPRLLEIQSAVEERDPNPAQEQEEQHQREGERKPGAEVDEIAVGKVAARQPNGRQRRRNASP